MSPAEALRREAWESEHTVRAIGDGAWDRLIVRMPLATLAAMHTARAALFSRAADTAEACADSATTRAAVTHARRGRLRAAAWAHQAAKAAEAAKETDDAAVLDAYLRRVAMDGAPIDPLTKAPLDPWIERLRTATAWRRCEDEAPRMMREWLARSRA